MFADTADSQLVVVLFLNVAFRVVRQMEVWIEESGIHKAPAFIGVNVDALCLSCMKMRREVQWERPQERGAQCSG